METIEEGISLTEKRLKNIPDFDIYKSILKQLHYLQMILNGSEPDRSKLEKIILGHFAVREFEESDLEFSEILKKCQNIAFKLSME
ncbi:MULTISPECIES: immunity protein Tsi6 family protein [Pseudoalteromonas]|uniref:Immunity protein Tsi6 family protein n=1 Tax=Pseudoalteromonas sp. SD03 TaxID=3231719 RepID=A0AB39AWK6_9GAMM|nr:MULTISPECIES: immunity protein Tsi6 family protein [Pseudoalteromonas]MDN3423895.1 immunity protein Tsi6 family protein [Pseudoalteromonas sp. APC 3896]MDN3472533.1 immunity protein Tsi6 family protein [Pseudoalteromonas sp. APC 4026]MDN3409219.1 immunity protein Tsi6 family protein [Pseudoalteromonas sp. APC 3894]MDN3416624.1 immunity protein Tsi6 family protein [Pseudoalteromonas sp. APC 3227]MDN3420321.1 immunity protein Tsi6 family protein [Pseudoalteromonas sp. APC 3895]